MSLIDSRGRERTRTNRARFTEEERKDLVDLLKDFPDESNTLLRHRFRDMKSGKHKARAEEYEDSPGAWESQVGYYERKIAGLKYGSLGERNGGAAKTAASEAARVIKSASSHKTRKERRADLDMQICAAQESEVDSPVRQPTRPAYVAVPEHMGFDPHDTTASAALWTRSAGTLWSLSTGPAP